MTGLVRLCMRSAGPALFLCLSLILQTIACGAPAQAGEVNKGLPVSSLTIATQSGTNLAVTVEVAANSMDREVGLMNRSSMDEDHGMIFVFPSAKPVMFWMKDTLLPLDMLFIDRAGRIISIKHDAKPMDLSIIKSGGAVTHVLEVNAGYAARHGVAKGDRVGGPALNFPAAD